MNFGHSLPIITLLPAVGALVLLFVPGRDDSAYFVRWLLAGPHDRRRSSSASGSGGSSIRPIRASSSSRTIAWIGDSIGYRMGVDGVSVLFVVLTALLMPVCVLASWDSITNRVREYMIVFLSSRR